MITALSIRSIRKILFLGLLCLTATKYRFILYVKGFGYMIIRMIIETIRKHIKTCGKTRYRIAKDTGVGEDQLCRIMQGKTCTAETADILLKYFGLTISRKPKKKGKYLKKGR